MAIVKLHFDGWLALPAAVRSRLDLRTGDTFSVEVMDDRIVLQLRTDDEIEVEEKPAAKVEPKPAKQAEAKPVKQAKAAPPPPAPPEPVEPPARKRMAKKTSDAAGSAPSLFPLKTRAVGGRKKSAPTA